MRRPSVRPSSRSRAKEEARRDAAERRRQLKPLKEKADIEERQIAALTAEIAKYDRTLADPLLFVQDPAKGNAVSKKRADAARKLAAAEERWMKALESYETAMADA